MSDAPASLSFRVLGSGSRGNATLIRYRQGEATRHILIDCGLSPRAVRLRMAEPSAVAPAAAAPVRAGGGSPRSAPARPFVPDAIVLTHLDHDHLQPGWLTVAACSGVPIYLHRRHRTRALQQGVSGSLLRLFEDVLEPVPGLSLEPLLFSHDELGTVGYVVEGASRRLGFATDLGHPPEHLFDRFRNLSALAIESNYDPDLQLSSGRPAFLVRRIMGGGGHLSNAQAAAAAHRIATATDALSAVVALHLSRQCNHPDLVRRSFRQHAASVASRLIVSDQARPTPWIDVPPADRGPHAEPFPMTAAGRAVPSLFDA